MACPFPASRGSWDIRPPLLPFTGHLSLQRRLAIAVSARSCGRSRSRGRHNIIVEEGIPPLVVRPALNPGAHRPSSYERWTSAAPQAPCSSASSARSLPQVYLVEVRQAGCKSSDVMKPLKIEELMDSQVANLSGGERQRAKLCVCLGKVLHLEELICRVLEVIGDNGSRTTWRLEGQIESAPAVSLPSADSLAEVLNQLHQMNEGIADIRVGLAEARMAYPQVFATPQGRPG